MTLRAFVLAASILINLVAVAANATDAPTNGLVGYYRFNGNANDESGMSNHAIVFGAVPATNRFGAAPDSYLLSERGQYIQTTGSVGFPVSTGNFAASVWVRLSQIIPGEHQIIFCNRELDAFQLSIGPFTGSTSRIQFYTGGLVESEPLEWVLGRWHNVMIVRAGSTLSIYRDAEIVGQNQISQGNSASPENRLLEFGWRSGSTHQLFGQLDDIRIYNRELSAQEVTEIYSAESLQLEIRPAVEVTFFAAHGKVYQTEASADFSNWFNVGASVTGNDRVVQQFYSTRGTTNRFYRVQDVTTP